MNMYMFKGPVREERPLQHAELFSSSVFLKPGLPFALRSSLQWAECPAPACPGHHWHFASLS